MPLLPSLGPLPYTLLPSPRPLPPTRHVGASRLHNLHLSLIVAVALTMAASQHPQAAVEAPVQRIAGADCYATTAAVSAALFAPGVDVAYLVTGENFPDLLAAAPAAVGASAPILLVKRDSIPPATAVELARLVPDQIVIVGGEGSVSSGVAGTLHAYARGTVIRIAGSDRYATAAQLSATEHAPGAEVVYLATGENFPDGLTAGVLAGAQHAPLLLAGRSALPTATATELRRLQPGTVRIVGGAGSVSDTVAAQIEAAAGAPVERIAGPDRYSTAAMVSAAGFPAGAPRAVLANGDGYCPAALMLAGARHAPLLLVPANGLPAAVAAELKRLGSTQVTVVGGPSVVSEGTLIRVAAIIRQPDPGPSATPSPTPSATATARRTPSAEPTPILIVMPTATPLPTPIPTVMPTATPLPTPTYSATPNTFHVAMTGQDSNPGTAAAPWRTPQKAADSASAGATVLIHSGTYPPFVVSRSGTAGAPLTFTGAPGEAAPVVAGNTTTVNTIRITAARYVTISGLIVQGADANSKSAGIRIEQVASSIVLSGNLIRNNRGRGIELFNANSVTISGNEITKNAKGIHVGLSTGSVVIANNRIHHNDRVEVGTLGDHGGVGVGFNHTTGGVVATGNLIWGNRAPSSDYGFDGGAFEIYGASNVRIEGNTVWDNRNTLETGTNDIGCVNNVFARNLAYGAAAVDRTVGMVLRCAEGMLVANNTFYHLDDFVFVLNAAAGPTGSSIEGLRILNNIAVMEIGARIYGIDSAMPASVVIDCNLVTSGGIIADVQGQRARDLATFRSWTGYEKTGLSADPRFVKPTALDFRLTAGSPAIDRGRVIPGVSASYWGAAPDLGRVESGP